MINLQKAIFSFGMLLSTWGAYGQSILAARQQELVRARQLANYDSTAESLMVNAFQKSLYASDSVKLTSDASKSKLSVSILPISLTLHNNSQLPYEWNLGAMVPAKWAQYHVSGGFKVSWRKWKLQAQPEWVWARNKPFETMSQELNPRLWRDYFLYYYNVTDIPERMDGAPFRRFYPGQSELSYTTGKFTVGLSTASKWWGPGYRNALVLSSNAAGFLNLSLATRKPVVTRWGNLEGELLAGNLVGSGVRPPRSYAAYGGQFIYPQKNLADRYVTGVTLNWQPKWVPGLYLGIAKASYLYYSDIQSPLDLLPAQGLLGNKVGKAEKLGRKSSLGSFFTRYVLPEEHAEVYLEYGRKDRSTMLWNLVSGKRQRNGYVAGFRKQMQVGAKGAFIQLGFELTQLQAGDTALIREPESWYTHNYVRQGYTHQGKSLGAGIGPGSNAQTLEVSWHKGAKRIGLQFERLRHNGDYYYAAMTYLGDYRRHWVNLSTTLKADWDFGPVNLHGTFGLIRSLNHQWIVVEARGDNFFSAGNEYLNIGSQLSVQYRF